MIGVMSCWTKLAIVGGLVLTGASLLWPTIQSTLMYKEMKLSPDSKSFKHWEVTPVPMYIDIYFHNWTNPKDVYTKTPQFSQMGPYRFYEKRTKVDLVWNDNGTVSYRQTRHWFFDAENTRGSLKDKVTTVNMIPATLAHKMRHLTQNDQWSVSMGLTALNYNIKIVKTVEELLFDGYSDHILTLLSYIPIASKKVTDKFGWFYKRNGSAVVDGLFNMDTGANDLKEVGKIRYWNAKNTTGAFSGKCAQVSGTSGEVFPPWLTHKSKLGLFSGDFCRTIYLDYEKDVVEHDIRGLKYTGSPFDSGHADPETSCYNDGDPVPLGLLNATQCRLGAPIFMSYPHFYLGSPDLQQQVGGMNPQKELHSFDLTVEPTFGVPLDLKGRFQVNALLQPNENFLLYKNLPRAYYMPLLWFDQRASLTGPLADEVHLMVTLHNICSVIAKSMLIVGVIAATAGITAACRAFNKAPPGKYLPYTVYALGKTNAKTEEFVVVSSPPSVDTQSVN